MGPYLHATHFVVLAALGGTCVLLRARESGRLREFFVAGVLFGAAFLMKQPGGVFALWAAALLLWAAARRTPPGWRTHAWRCGALTAGVMAPIVLTCLALWMAGVWDRFWWWTVTYALVHATRIPWPLGCEMLSGYMKSLGWDLGFWLLAAGLPWLLFQKNRADEKFCLCALLVFSFAGVAASNYFTGHYFVMMLPVIALLCAKALASLQDWLAASRARALRLAPCLLFYVLLTADVWDHRDLFFQWTPEEATARIYPGNEFQVYPVVGAYLREHAPSNATMAVLGSEPELLFYARRRSVTGYIYMYDLVQQQPFREWMENDMIREIERGKPDYIVTVNIELSWKAAPAAAIAPLRKWMLSYTGQYYEPYGAVTFPPHEFYWGADCFQRAPPEFQFLTLYRRKPGAGESH
jgi:hypothetical protein